MTFFHCIDVNKTDKIYDFFVSVGWVAADPSVVSSASAPPATESAEKDNTNGSTATPKVSNEPTAMDVDKPEPSKGSEDANMEVVQDVSSVKSSVNVDTS